MPWRTTRSSARGSVFFPRGRRLGSLPGGSPPGRSAEPTPGNSPGRSSFPPSSRKRNRGTAPSGSTATGPSRGTGASRTACIPRSKWPGSSPAWPETSPSPAGREPGSSRAGGGSRSRLPRSGRAPPMPGGRWIRRSTNSAATSRPSGRRLPRSSRSFPSPELEARVGPYLESVRKMAEATARFQRLLAEEVSDPAFLPESFTTSQMRSCFQTIRRKVLLLAPALRRASRGDVAIWGPRLERLRMAESRLLDVLADLLRKQIGTLRIRCHGNLDLAHFASLGSGYILTGVPGLATSPFVERRLRRSPLWDVAGMLTSFHSAVAAALAHQESLGEVAVERWTQLERGAARWYDGVSRTFLGTYRTACTGSRLERSVGFG